MGTSRSGRRHPSGSRLTGRASSGRLSLAALAALLLAGAVLPACAPRFDMVGEEATGDPIANKRVGQEPKQQ